MRVLITGSAGFIGFHLAKRLLADGHEVLGYDAMTPYYDVVLKQDRTAILLDEKHFTFTEAALEDREKLENTLSTFAPDIVVHLAAQAGVRHAFDHPDAYINSNTTGTFNLLEALKTHRPRHLLIASTSSIYGGNKAMPFKETSRTDFPVSLYAATKKAGEAMSHAYAHLWKIPSTCFRFFTVYGPWGRPDMAPFKFVDAIAKGRPIEVYGNGQMQRDFTYIDDLVEAVIRLMDVLPTPGNPVAPIDSVSPVAPWRSVNIGCGQPVGLMSFIETIEACLGKHAIKEMLPMQQGDVAATFADAALLKALTGFTLQTSVATGMRAFVDWYNQYYANEAV